MPFGPGGTWPPPRMQGPGRQRMGNFVPQGLSPIMTPTMNVASFSRSLSGAVLMATIFLFAACRQDPELTAPAGEAHVPLKLTVLPVWDGGPFDKNTVYGAAGDQRVQVTELKFFLAPLELTGPESAYQVFDADLFDVANGAVERVLSVPPGHYDAMHLGLGLPYELNHRDLATIPPNAPTGNNSGMYWGWGTQYRFVIFSGRFDSDPNGTGEPPYTFDLHTGLDTCYRTRTIPLQLEAAGDDTLRMTIRVDIARFFTDGNEVLDLSQGAVWHGDPDELPLALKVADLQVKALSADPE